VYGLLLVDLLRGIPAFEVIERDDGNVSAYDASYLIASPDQWEDEAERQAVELVRGRVLDLGAGGGRVSLHLQERGHDVVADDSSAGALRALFAGLSARQFRKLVDIVRRRGADQTGVGRRWACRCQIGCW
jgi:SAM-dependent methyltransferase